MDAQPIRLAERYDVALYDLDGVLYVGRDEVPHASASVTAAAASGMRALYVTNNASRSPEEVADQLRQFGLPVDPSDVTTSSMVAAELLAGRHAAGSPILVIGGPGLWEAVERVGLKPVDRFGDGPVAVVQGYGPDVGWRELAQASYAVRAGVPWLATNSDLTVPTPDGIAPGNGALVQAVAAATGATPEMSGKPAPLVFQSAVARVRAGAPLVVGDRLDTDIKGAVAAGYDSLLVLTGVTDVQEAATAGPEQRPTWVAPDLRGLVDLRSPAVASEGGWEAGDARAEITGAAVRLARAGSAADSIQAVLAAAWAYLDESGRPVDVGPAAADLESLAR